MRQELFSHLLPHFLTSHPAYSTVLQYAWHAQDVPARVHNQLMQAMANWCLHDDTLEPTRVSRILDVAQDIKVSVAEHCLRAWLLGFQTPPPGPVLYVGCEAVPVCA